MQHNPIRPPKSGSIAELLVNVVLITVVGKAASLAVDAANTHIVQPVLNRYRKKEPQGAGQRS